MENILAKYLPEQSLDYCIQLSNQYTYQLDLSFDRKTKFGHYKYLPKSKQHVISINKGLTKPLFLITFLHELAHLEVMVTYGRKVQPHGLQWKKTFSDFLTPVLQPAIFESKLLSALQKHVLKPKATLMADPHLWKVLFNDNTATITLDDIEIGRLFMYRKRTFKKLETRRTRVLCFEPSSKHKYLIPRLTPVELID